MPDFIDKKMDIAFNSENLRKIFFAAILFSVAYVMYGFNRHTPLIADDMVLASFVREHNFYEIVDAFYDYYMYWGGRIVVHIFAMFFLSLDKNIFNAANTLMYVIFNLLILFHGLGKKIFSPFALIFINVVLFCFTPAFGQDFLWLDGACNYLWGMVLVLAFFVPYRLQMMNNDNIFNHGKKCLAVIFFAGIVAGWTNENMSIALIFMTIACIYFCRKNHGRIFKWQIAGAVGAVIGSMFLILAPGNFNRLAVEGGGQHIDILKNLLDITAMFIDFQFLFYPLCFTIIFFRYSFKNISLKKNFEIFPYLIGFFISMYSMVGSPYYTDRAKLGSLVLILILAVYFYGNVKLDIENIRRYTALGICMIFLFVFKWHIANEDIRTYDRIERGRVEKIMVERERRSEIILEDNPPKSRYVGAYGLDTLSSDKNYGLNKTYAKFYNVNAVSVKK